MQAERSLSRVSDLPLLCLALQPPTSRLHALPCAQAFRPLASCSPRLVLACGQAALFSPALLRPAAPQDCCPSLLSPVIGHHCFCPDPASPFIHLPADCSRIVCGVL
ncbi:hypothetical protein VTO73DRAFT_13566 [Trametes versicolor]